jgi:hypothetical protein
VGHAHVHTPHELVEPREGEEESAPPPAFRAWLAQRLFTNPRAIPGPLYIVFFAAVLFFAGISLRLDWRPLKIAVLGMALTLLVGGAAFVFTLPLA